MSSDFLDTLKERARGMSRRCSEAAPGCSFPGGLLQVGLLGRLGLGRRGHIPIGRILVFLGYAALLPIPLITKNYYLMRAGGSVGI
ncbi:MAG: hypothetical protein GX460_09665, partial [Firmicutes bacterium]|nr:hypothetical protein [Bacillota bacterium]